MARITILKRISFICVPLLFYCVILASASDFTPFLAQVNTDNINIRSDATVSSEVICQVKKLDTLEVLGESYDWYRVRLPKNAPAFIRKDLVNYLDENNAKVAKEKVNIRLKASTSSAIIGKADKDEPLKIVELGQDWYKIEPVKNSFGWVHKQFLTKINTATAVLKKEEVQNVAVNVIERVRIEGELLKYKKFFKPPAAYQLVTGENQVFLLKSKAIDLKGYLNKNIIIAGSVSGSYKEIPIVEVESVISD